jgi:type II secretory pathway predicted ATPase ExeA
MTETYRSFFGFTREPFSSDLKIEEILKTDTVLSVADRIAYAVRLGAMAMITGEVGSGSSGSRPEAARSWNCIANSPGNLKLKRPATAGRL